LFDHPALAGLKAVYIIVLGAWLYICRNES
jgi:hypothetical protein